ncbi:elongation factor G [Clostridium oceanicum]|uniref:Elongation factor G n=1 Tax=Clostridium oceanicum TaxID=1543 RepID=A0ABN1JSH5_9CLOT
MKDYKTEDIRNIGIIGHSGSGKTTLLEEILYYTKTTDRLGKIEEGNTISDYDIEEKKRKISISTSIASCNWDNKKINLIDMPGYFDFVGENLEGLKASDMAVILVSATSGIQVGTEKSWKYVNENNVPRSFYINKLDRENTDFDLILSDLKDKFGMCVVPIQYPIGKDNDFKGIVNVISKKARIFDPKTKKMCNFKIPDELVDKIDECKEMIIESVAETDEELLEKYFDEGTLSDEEIYKGLIKGISNGEIAPVMCGSVIKEIGIETLLEDIVECFPTPCSVKSLKATNLDKEEVSVKINENEKLSALVFKTVVDPFVGKLSLFKVVSGKMKQDSLVFNSSKNKKEKINNLYFLKGKEQISTKEVVAGDIGAVSKLQCTQTGDTLCDDSYKIEFDKIDFPKPVISMVALPCSKNDEDKISSALNKLMDEDPTFSVSRDLENAETIISGLGEMHLEVISNKIKNKFGAHITLREPKIPYRETIKVMADVRGKHKKQSGGHGQYGDVKIKFEPGDSEELEFVDKIVGGVVPRQYIPAVEKGLKECMKHGVLAGYPVIKLKATLHDGSYHSVDSSEMAFKIAASLAYKKGLKEAKPILLEPIMHVEVLVPNDCMGDIIADINKKRGRILGMDSKDNIEKVVAEVPASELIKYATDLRSMTQARGNFTMEFERYEEVPSFEAEKIIEEVKVK